MTKARDDLAEVCAGTPTVQVLDNRGLNVRILQLNRHLAAEPVQVLITQQTYTASGVQDSSVDPRLFALRQGDPTLAANFRYQSSLSGRGLRSRSVDAGEQVTLYDLEGAPLWQTNSRQQTRRWAYDALHRPRAVYEQAGTAAERTSERLVYGDLSPGLSAANARGQLLRHYDTAGLQAVPAYGLNGQALHTARQLLRDPAAESDWSGAEADWQAHLETTVYRSRQAYNALGAGQWGQDARGHQQSQRYNQAGQLVSSQLTLAGHAQPKTILAAVSYNAAGQVLREAAGNGVVSESSYEPQTQRLSQLRTTRLGGGRSSLLQDLTYRYDPVGNIVAIEDAAQAVRHHRNQRVVAANAYQYDALYQLIQASGRENAGNGPQGPGLPAPEVPLSQDPSRFSNYTRTYSYDAAGNRLQVRHAGASAYTQDMLVSPRSNRAIEQTGHLQPSDVEGHFDEGGNLRQLAPGQALSWDGRNQLQRVVQVARPSGDDDAESYQYDGGGQRIRKTTVSHTSGTVRTAQVLYLPGLELRVTRSDSGGTSHVEEDLQVISAGAGRQAVRVLHWASGQPTDLPNDQLRASLDNQIGSSLLELDEQADVLTQEEYFPFGGTAVWSGKSQSETKYKFVRYSGKERDATGLYYYGFRYYAPWLGRWLNPDPAGTVDGLNLFRMVGNNPITFYDIDGRVKYPYVFTHEVSSKALQEHVGRDRVLIAGSVHGEAKAAQNDVTKTHINPVFTRVLSVVKTGKMTDVTRAAMRPNLVGGNSSIVLILDPAAETSQHSRVDDFIAKNKSKGWPKFAAPLPKNKKQIPTGFYKSFIGDVGKSGATSRQESSPKSIAESATYSYANEQHWHKGIDLDNNLLAVVVKLKAVSDEKWELAEGSNSRYPEPEGGKIFDITELFNLGEKNPELMKTLQWTTSVTMNVYGVSSNYPLENVLKKINSLPHNQKAESSQRSEASAW